MIRIVTPAWNDAAFLRASVESSLWLADEVVIMLGPFEGSLMPEDRDGTERTALALAHVYAPRVRTLSPRSWRDEVDSVNVALSGLATTDWWLRVDADETVHAAPDVRGTLGVDQSGSPTYRVPRYYGAGLPPAHGLQTRLFRGDVRYSGTHKEAVWQGRTYPLHARDHVWPGIIIVDHGYKRPKWRLGARAAYQRDVLPLMEERP